MSEVPTYAEDRARVEQRLKQVNECLDEEIQYENLRKVLEEERDELQERLETMKEHEDEHEWPPEGDS